MKWKAKSNDNSCHICHNDQKLFLESETKPINCVGKALAKHAESKRKAGVIRLEPRRIETVY